MSQIKLTADSGGGTTSLKAPSSTTSNADVVLKLPVADGSANQVLKTDGSGQLSFTSNAGTTINNNADNRIITGSGTANTLNGESGLTFDGNTINFTSGSGDARLTLIGTEGNDARISLVADDGDDHIDQYNIRSNADDNSFSIDQFESGSFVERFTIANGGNVGIGTVTPSNLLHLKSGSPAIRLEDTDANGSAFSIIEDNNGLLKLRNDAGNAGTGSGIAFEVDASERMRIDSDGNVGIGVTPTMAAGGGLHVRGPSGHQARLHMTTSNSGDTGNDGFYIIQQGAESSNNDTNFINYETANMKFSTAGTERLRVQSGGGISFNGDTATANALDDYEEGTFTPRLGGTSNYSTYYVEGTGKYIKIGRQVTVSVRFNSVSLSNSAQGTVNIINMPFTSGHNPTNGITAVTNNAQYYKVGGMSGDWPSWYIPGGSTAWHGLISRNANTWIDWDVSNFETSGMYINFCATYFTS